MNSQSALSTATLTPPEAAHSSVIHPEIEGWGADVDPRNRPAIPKERFPVQGTGAHWETPEQQMSSVYVLHSLERPSVTPVFGTPNPPKGLSGLIRRFAFRYSESHFGHWIPLLLADRVDMVEGVIEDIAHGQFPNLVKEMGFGALWKHSRKKLLTTIGVSGGAAALTAGGIWLWKQRRGSALRQNKA